jgi:hypothetical protein
MDEELSRQIDFIQADLGERTMFEVNFFQPCGQGGIDIFL